jgi:hypothetical protein
MKEEGIKNLIRDMSSYLKNDINSQIKEEKIGYRSSGVLIENLATDALRRYFKENYSAVFSVAKDKNDFPDCRVKIKEGDNEENLFFEIKSAISTKNPANDLGTLGSFWKDHLVKKVGLDNIKNLFLAFLQYSTDKSGVAKNIEQVYIAHYFKFIGTTKDSFLSYHEKDGNMRPKSWDDINKLKVPLLNNEELENFLVQYYTTVLYRSSRIIKKHKNIVQTFRKQENIVKMYKGVIGVNFDRIKKRINKELSTQKFN